MLNIGCNNIESKDKHWSCLYLSQKLNIGHDNTFVKSYTLAIVILESIVKHWLR